jgi:hypothetical protein
VSATVVVGDTYTLTFENGNRLPDYDDGGPDFGDFQGGGYLQVGGPSGAIYSATGIEAPPGSFTLWTASFVGTSADAGDSITIFLTASQAQGDFSDVTLTQTGPLGPTPPTVPEGGSSWLYILLAAATSLGAIFFTSRKQLAARA